MAEPKLVSLSHNTIVLLGVKPAQSPITLPVTKMDMLWLAKFGHVLLAFRVATVLFKIFSSLSVGGWWYGLNITTILRLFYFGIVGNYTGAEVSLANPSSSSIRL